MKLEQVFDEAIAKDASDIHLVKGIQPMLRVARDLLSVDESEVLTDEDMFEIYEYLIKGSLEKDEYFKLNKKLDLAMEYKEIRFRTNISYSDDVPVVTLRLIKNILPKFEELRCSRYSKTYDISTTRFNACNRKNKLW